MKRILAATDLSTRSDRALQRALALAEQNGAELDVVYVLDDDGPDRILRQRESDAREAIHSVLETLPGAKSVKVATTVLRDQAYQGVLGRAEETSADLIVLGVHRHKARDTFRGATAERIVRFGRRPVLMVKDPIAGPYRRALVPADHSGHSRAAILLAAQLVPKGDVHVVHATHAPFTGFLGRKTLQQFVDEEQAQFAAPLNALFEKAAADLGPLAPRFNLVLKEGPVDQVVREKAADLAPDLLAIGAHSRTGVAYAMLGSAAEGLLADPPTDILIGKAF